MRVAVSLSSMRAFLAIVSLAAAAPAEAAMHALIITGLAGEAQQVERQVAELEGWRKIFASSGVAEADVTVIRSLHSAADPAAAGKPPVHQQVLDHLAAWKQNLDADDDICLVFVGRVASFGQDRFFQMRGRRLSAQELAAALDTITARSQTIFLTGPGAAGFARTLAGDRRVIVSATSDDREINATQFGIAWCQAAQAAPEGTFLEWLAAADAKVKQHFTDRKALRTEHALLLVGRRPEVEAPFAVALTGEERAAWTLARPSVPVVGVAAVVGTPAPRPAVAAVRPAAAPLRRGAEEPVPPESPAERPPDPPVRR